MFRKTLFARCLTLLVLALLSTNLAWGKEGDVLAEVQGTGSSYGRQTTTDSYNVGWITIGQSGYFGINSAKNNTGAKAGVNATDLPVAQAVNASATSSTSTESNSCTGYYTFYTTTALKNVGSIEFYYSANSGNSDATAYVVMGDAKSASGGAAYVQVPLATSSTSKQGVSLGTSGTFTFTFAETQKDAKYYGVVIATSSYKRMTGGKITIKEGAGDTPAAELVSIAISGTPKTAYEIGESFDVSDLTVTGTYSDASTSDLTDDAEWTIDPATFTSTSQNSVSVTATVDGKSDTKNYIVTVTEHVVTPGTYEIVPNNTFFGIEVQTTGSHDPVTGTQNDITITHSGGSNFYCNASQIRTYKGNTLTFSVPTGYEITCIVLAVTDNASYSANVGTYTVSTKTWAGNANEVILTSGQSSGNYQITKITATFASTKTLTSIAIKTPPTKTTYNVGDNFNPAGLVITATYDTGNPEDITYADNENKFTFNPDLTTALTKVNNKVTITYGGKSVDQAITVNLNKLTAPTNLQATNIASTSATLTWDEVANASSYEVNVIDAGTYDETFTPTANSLLVEGLTANTEYLWSVKAIGDETTYANSDESASSNFTTSAPPTVTYTVSFNGNNHGTPASESIAEPSAGAGVTLPDCTPSEGYQFVGWATTNTATEADAGVVGATYYPSANTTLYAVYNSVYTINYMVNGVNTGAQENVLEGTPLVFPTVTAPDADHVFRGWVTEAIEGTTDTEPVYVNTTGLTATQSITYYAVFAEKSGTGETTYTKLSSNSFESSATYVLAANESSNSTTLHYFSSYTSTTANESWGVTSTTATDAITFTLSGTASALVAQDASGNYLTPLATGKFRMSSTIQTLDLHNDGTIYNPTSGSTGYRLRYNHNNGSGGFRWYNGTTGTSAYFYKAETEIIYSNYCTTVVAKELTSISLSGEYPTEFWKGDAFSHEGMTVTAHYSNADDEDVTDKATFTGYDMAAAGEQTVTVTYEGKTETYSITVKTIANTQETAYTTAKAKELIDAGKDLGTEVYVKGTVSAIVTEFSSDYGNITFDVSADGQTEGQQFRFYRNFKGANKTPWVSAAECPAVGDDVIGLGKLTKYGNIYEFTEGNYIVSLIRVATLSIADITVSLGEEINPVISSNVPENERTIEYSVPSENVVKVDEEGNLVTVAVGGPVVVTATLTDEGYKDATTTFEVTVIKALQSIEVKTAPTTISYKAGDKFDPAGLVITAYYNDESTEDVAYAGNEDKFTFTPSLETPLTTENTSVTITYAGKTTTQAISVRALNTYDITWKANGEQFATTQVTEGNALVLPETNPDNVGDMVFQGWIDSEDYYDAETAPEYIVPSEIIPEANATYYAVFAKATTEFQEKDVTYTFTSKSWGDATSSWTSGKDGNEYTTNQGVQVTTGVTGANATSKSAFTEVTKVVVNYCTNTSKGKGTIQVKVGDGTAQSYSVSAPSSGGTTLRDTDDMIFENETGNVNITVECGTNSIYINSITITSKVGEETISNFCTTVAPIVISENTVWDGNVTINGNTTVTIGSGAVLTVKGALINTNPEKLIIKDGGQLVFNNSGKDNNIKSGVKATVEKNIVPYGSGKGDKGWHFLAAPMTDFAVESFINQANGNYDLYRWYIKDNGDPIWYNYKAHIGEFETNFVSGRGYLAAYETTNLLQMQGTLNAGTTFSFTVNSKGNFTLLGNPFTYDLKWSEFTKETGIFDNGFAVVNSETGIIEYVFGDNPIKVGTGFMVYTEKDDATLSFTKGNESGSGKSNDIIALNLFASNGNGEDNTIIVIDDENGGFAKADNFNTNVPQIYTERLQTKYGIRNFNTNTKEFNVSFKAVGEGSNTIRLETIGEFDYVHLYDKLLDVDVDMLLEGSYTFEASEGDDTHRFIVRIDKGNTGIDENETENFVNVYNGEIHVSGSGEVQIFDVMGRIVHSEVISGDATISTGGFKGGVYVVRLIGDGWTKTEKIVVRR